MSAIHFILSQIDINALGWTLVHFLWQGIAIALLLKCVHFISNNAQIRYAFACLALTLMIAAPTVTFLLLYTPKPIAPQTDLTSPPFQSFNLTPSHPINTSPQTPTPAPAYQPTHNPQSQVIIPSPQPTAFPQPTWSQRLTNTLNQNLSWFVSLWFLGVVCLSLRLLYVWFKTQRLKHKNVRPILANYEHILNDLLKRLKIHQTVRLLESTIAQSPMVIGWLKPVILIPTSAFLGLTQQQIETILVHELAHIRRYDYLINLLQTLVETLLFYHPAVWWISRQMRIEREHCCDDLTLATCGNAITYARALTQLETHRHLPAVAATDGSLRQRIQRILSSQPSKTHQARAPFATSFVVALSIILLFACNTTSPPKTQTTTPSKIQAATPFTHIEQITSADSAITHVKNRYMAFDFEAGFIEGEHLQKRFPASSELKAWTIWNKARSGAAPMAVTDAESMIQKNETDPWGWYALTGALGYSDHQEEFRTRAYEAHKKFLALNPTYPDSIWLTATAIHRQFLRKKDDIIPYVDARIHTAPNPDYLLTLKGFILGWMAKRKDISTVESRKRFASALDAFEKARQINPQNVWAYYLPGLIYAENNRKTEARFLFRKARELSPQAPFVCDQYLRIIYQSAGPEEHKKQEAQTVIDTMLQGRETYPQALQTAYFGYGRSKLQNKANELEDRILQITPSPPIASFIFKKRNNPQTFFVGPVNDPVLELKNYLDYFDQLSSSKFITNGNYTPLDMFNKYLKSATYQYNMSNDALQEIVQKTLTLQIPNAHHFQFQALIAFIEKTAFLDKSGQLSLEEKTKYFEQAEAFARQLLASANTHTDSNKVRQIQALAYDALGWLYLKERRWDDAFQALQIAYRLDKNGFVTYHLGQFHEHFGEDEKAEEFYKEGVFSTLTTERNEWELLSIYRKKHQTNDGFYAYLAQLAQDQKENQSN